MDKLLSSLIMSPALNGLLVTKFYFSFGKSGMKQLDRTTTNHADLSLLFSALWPRGYKTFFMLNLTEQGISIAHKI